MDNKSEPPSTGQQPGVLPPSTEPAGSHPGRVPVPRAPSDPPGAGAPAGPRRWLVLAAGTAALTAGSAFQYGLPYLIPALRSQGLSLEQTGVLVACPTAGLLLTLIAWGALADHSGERLVLSAGLSAAGALLLAAIGAHGMVALGACLALAGAAGASVYAASGRLILGWFAANQRGLAMGIRQSSQPLGVAVAALALPRLGRHGLTAPLIFLGGFCLAAAVLVVLAVRDPAKPVPPPGQRPRAPYRSPVLWRIHAASAVLIVPQFTVGTFAVVYLVEGRHWDAATAGTLLAVTSVGGGVARLLAGAWSDRAGSRLRPMRALAVAIAATLLALTALAFTGVAAAVPVLAVAAVLAVSTNGLAFTAVAEYAGPSWAGRALGVQNTGQNIVAAIVPPAMAAVIGAAGYAPAFAIAGTVPLAAALLIPVASGCI